MTISFIYIYIYLYIHFIMHFSDSAPFFKSIIVMSVFVHSGSNEPSCLTFFRTLVLFVFCEAPDYTFGLIVCPCVTQKTFEKKIDRDFLRENQIQSRFTKNFCSKYGFGYELWFWSDYGDWSIPEKKFFRLRLYFFISSSRSKFSLEVKV